MFWITGLLGLAMVAAPWVFNYTNDAAALWASVIVGLVVFLVSAYKGLVHGEEKWEYYIAGLAGLVAIIAPFALGFTALTTALWTSIFVGTLLVILSGYEAFFAEPEVA